MILFHCPAAPRHTVDNPYAGEPGEPARVETSTLPTFELTDRNAADLLRLLGLPSASCGDIAPDDFPRVSRLLEQQVQVLSGGRRSCLQREPRQYEGTLAGVLGIGPGQDGHLMLGGAPLQVHDCGRSAEGALQAVRNLLDLVRAAAALGLPVAWD